MISHNQKRTFGKLHISKDKTTHPILHFLVIDQSIKSLEQKIEALAEEFFMLQYLDLVMISIVKYVYVLGF